ncbi:DNA helicase [uncultured phage cr56_1]|jgi:replicative DNA helicase|uniref:DNA helicase n=1 Tax=uncultured phage cr56_1 TaxID=2772081 RepID=A0A7M1RRS4_9CAUD|nr:DNA helicase [uncultured phage cr56_1]QOR56834.1 DNA helicase [uncultured phage cr56_1]
MEQISTNTLTFRHISSAAIEAVEYIKKRKNHEIESLKTRWKKFNTQCMGGIEPNTIYTIVGISGSGKSSFVNTLENDLIDLNSDQDVIVLNFSFEMLSSRQVGRKISSKLRQTTAELYSANNSLTDELLENVEETTQQIKSYPIYYVDTPGTVDNIASTIDYFYENKAKGKRFVIILDHTLLVEGQASALQVISDLQKLFIKVKKYPNTTIIQLSQMNRNIEAPDRINNPSMHYPMRSDISSADTIFHASDYVICIHRPELLNIQQYGPNRLLVKNKVYLHILKNRDAGECSILEFDNDLKYNNLIETVRDEEPAKKFSFSNNN